MFGVRQQRKAEFVFVIELGELGRKVGADTDDDRVTDLLGDVAQSATLRRAARRISLWVEVHEHLGASETRKLHLGVGLVGKGERRCFRTDSELCDGHELKLAGAHRLGPRTALWQNEKGGALPRSSFQLLESQKTQTPAFADALSFAPADTLAALVAGT
ncbi:unannotated protein [freshwater metagenome]|uniref:Unannotated protein n=1 Tax=freshwater metagenome TaxID=449393 RepID=A0A6J7NDM5_9ZZZZ